MTAGTHAAVRAGVLVGAVAIIFLFVAIGVVWMRRAQCGRTPHHRSNSTASQPDSVAMSYSKAHDLPTQSPKHLARLYDSGNFSVTSSPFGSYGLGTSGPQGPQEPDITALLPHREMDSRYATSPPSSLVFDEPTVHGSAAGLQLTPRIARGLLVNHDWDEMKTQSFGSSEIHGLVQLVTSSSSHPGVTVQNYPSHLISDGLELSPIFTSLRFPSPKIPTHPSLGGTKPSRHDQPDPSFAFPSPPPSPNGSILATISDFSLSSSSSSAVTSIEVVGEESLIWSDVFSLDDYDTEEMLTLPRVPIAVQDQLPSPPPTPTPIVLFTPPSPPNAILVLAYPTVEVDTERLHVWRSAVKKVRTDNEEPNSEDISEDIFAAGHHWHNSYKISGDINLSLATFTLAHEQAKVARARRGNKVKPHRTSMVGLNFREAPPAYQSLGYEIQSRLARKRAPSLSENIPTRDKHTERFLLQKIASIVKPRPTLEIFEPLLCRKVDISKLQAQRLLGFQAQAIPPNVSGDHDPANFRRHAALDAPVKNTGSQSVLNDECIDEAAVMGLAV